MFDKQPKKYTKVNGVMKLNPAFKKWKEKQNNKAAEPGIPPVAVTTLLAPKEALAVVSSMEDHEKLNANTKLDIPLAESTNSTIEMLQGTNINLIPPFLPYIIASYSRFSYRGRRSRSVRRAKRRESREISISVGSSSDRWTLHFSTICY